MKKSYHLFTALHSPPGFLKHPVGTFLLLPVRQLTRPMRCTGAVLPCCWCWSLPVWAHPQWSCLPSPGSKDNWGRKVNSRDGGFSTQCLLLLHHQWHSETASGFLHKSRVIRWHCVFHQGSRFLVPPTHRNHSSTTWESLNAGTVVTELAYISNQVKWSFNIDGCSCTSVPLPISLLCYFVLWQFRFDLSFTLVLLCQIVWAAFWTPCHISHIGRSTWGILVVLLLSFGVASRGPDKGADNIVTHLWALGNAATTQGMLWCHYV